MTLTFELFGKRYFALNGGPQFRFMPIVRLFVAESMSYGHSSATAPDQCGWLTDKYGLSCHIVPRALRELVCRIARSKKSHVTEAMFTMSKVDIA